MLTAGIITAAGKEIADITVKSLDKQQYQRYHGFKNIVKDSLKDMHNNGIGWRYGLAPDSDCQSLLYHKL